MKDAFMMSLTQPIEASAVTPILWSGLTPCSQEMVAEFEDVALAYRLYPSTKVGRLWDGPSIARLEGCPWEIKKPFWDKVSKAFVSGMRVQNKPVLYGAVLIHSGGSRN